MAGSVNKVILVGRVGKDPEVRHSQDGKAIVNLSLATLESWRDKATGERKEKTEWHRVTAFNGVAKSLRKCVKGMRVLVEGRNKTTRRTAKDGAVHYTTEVIAERVTFLSWPKPKNENDDGKFIEDDEIPF